MHKQKMRCELVSAKVVKDYALVAGVDAPETGQAGRRADSLQLIDYNN